MEDYNIEITPNKPMSDDEYIKHVKSVYANSLAPLPDSITKTYDDTRKEIEE